MTPILTPRRAGVTARWLPVHSPPSQSPVCWGPERVGGGGGGSCAEDGAGYPYSSTSPPGSSSE